MMLQAKNPCPTTCAHVDFHYPIGFPNSRVFKDQKFFRGPEVTRAIFQKSPWLPEAKTERLLIGGRFSRKLPPRKNFCLKNGGLPGN